MPDHDPADHAFPKASPEASSKAFMEHLPIRITINGTEHARSVAPWTTLLDLLREDLHLTGSKKGCDHGQCGSCTVLVNGERKNACLLLAVMQDGARVTTVEGLAGPDGTLHPVQDAFVRHDAFQCGYCTPGQILSAVALLEEGRAHTGEEIREAMSGNLCRCGAYHNIVRAIQDVMEQRAAGQHPAERAA